MKIKKFLFFYYRSIIVFVLILILSTIPASEVKKVAWITIPNFDKLVHLGMYFCFNFTLIYDISKAKLNFSNFKIYTLSAIIALSYGGFLEIIQGTLTNSRSADIVDFLFNIIGVFVAILVWLAIKRTK